MFKRLLLIAVCAMIALTAAKADEGQKVASKVQKVTVFLRGAQVTRSAAVNINAGTSDLIFNGIAPNVAEQSIQVHATGDFTILSVKQETNYLVPNEDTKTKQIQALQDQKKMIWEKIAMQNNLILIYQTEEAVLAKNQFIKPDNQFLDVVKLKQALDFQTERLTAIKEKERVVGNQLALLNTEMQKYDNQINEINNGNRSMASTNIIVTVSAKVAVQSVVTLSYVIANAGWSPGYDIRAKNTNSPLVIVYKANVFQNSGEEWKNVKLTLSTGSPNRNSIKPELNPYYLNVSPVERALSGRTTGVAYSSGYVYADKSASLAEVAVAEPVAVTMVENQTSVDFNIENPYSVTNDGKACQVEINQVSLPATYQYYVAPKLSIDVFLTAQVTDLNKYNFLSGPANLFFEGTYIGRSRIDTRVLSDTLNLSLGTDRGIQVKRTLEKELTKNQTLGANRKETKSWLIELKNRKNQKIDLLVEDQIPVSQNGAIEVESQETSGGKTDALTGKISWNLTLNSQGDKKLRLRYMVKYPKAEQLTVL